MKPDVKKVINYLIPQGWSFFTRSPREDLVEIAILNDEIQDYIYYDLRSRSKSYYGLDRINRYIAYEISMILEGLKFKYKSDNIFNDPKYRDSTLVITNNKLKYLPKSTYKLTLRKVKPWAWASFDYEIEISNIIVKID
jgi:hypothetical protein